MTPGIIITVVVPVRCGREKLGLCLESIKNQTSPPEELIVVVDEAESFPEDINIANGYTSNVLQIKRREGASQARNLGAKRAKGQFLLFIDADVICPPNLLEKVREHIRENPQIPAFFGSYDETPYEKNFLSQYRNLIHHYVHQNSSEKASTFWSACGLIRRDLFKTLGGFDPKIQGIEDIELGYRIREAGQEIRLIKTLQVKHLKHWTFFSLIYTDLFLRALPWTKLIIDSKNRFINDLNLNTRARHSVALSFALPILMLIGFFYPWAFLLGLGVWLYFLNMNSGLYRFLALKQGWFFALRAIPMHWLYYWICGIGFILGGLMKRKWGTIFHGNFRNHFIQRKAAASLF